MNVPAGYIALDYTKRVRTGFCQFYSKRIFRENVRTEYKSQSIMLTELLVLWVFSLIVHCIGILVSCLWVYWWGWATYLLWTGEEDQTSTLLGKLTMRISLPLLTSVPTTITTAFGVVSLLFFSHSMATILVSAFRKAAELIASRILRRRGDTHKMTKLEKWHSPPFHLPSFRFFIELHRWLPLIRRICKSSRCNAIGPMRANDMASLVLQILVLVIYIVVHSSPFTCQRLDKRIRHSRSIRALGWH